MDALLSLPVLGYFLGPSTFSTSINLLFFYMTWSTLALSQPPLKVEVMGTLGIRMLSFLVPSTLFLVFDSVIPSLAVNIKTQGESALPTRAGNTRSSRKRGPQWYKVIGLSIFNVLLGVAVQLAIELLFTEVLNVRSALQVTTTLPMPWSIAKHIIRSLLLREVLQYYAHRFILHPSKPNTFSRLHKEYFHSITSPYSFASQYDHPLPYLLLRFIPTYLPSILFRTHVLTYLLTLFITTLEETLSLSGYSTIPGMMLGGITRRQDLHSQGYGKGNFAPLGILDWVHGTGVGPDVVDDMKNEAEKHHLRERGGKALKNTQESGRGGLSAWKERRKSTKKG